MIKRLTTPFINNVPTPEKRLEIFDTHLVGLALRVTENGNKSFVYRYRFGDKVKRYTIGKYPAVSLAKAREEAKNLSYKVSQGIDPQAEKQERKKPKKEPLTFKELADKYSKRHLPELKQSTRTEYQRVIDVELNPVIGELPVKEIKRKQIIDLLDAIALERGTPVLSNRVRATLSSIFTFGIDKALFEDIGIEVNPVLAVKKIKKRKNGEKVERKRKRTYSPDELKEIWTAFSIQDEPVRSLFMILLLCGQRLGETRRCKWEHINLKNGFWTIPAGETKAKRENIVPLSKQALEIIQTLKKSAGNSEYVFQSNRIENEPVKWLQKASDRVKDITGIDDFRIHDLRRTAATNMAELGTDRTVLGKVLNHKELAGDDQVTAIYDRHDYLEQKRAALQKWANYLERILKDEPINILKLG